MSGITHPTARDCLAPAVVTMIATVDGSASSPRPAPPSGRGGSAIENGLVCSNPDAAREGIVPAQTTESPTRAADPLCAISKLRSSRPSVKFALRSRQRIDGDEVTRVIALSR